MHQLSGLQMHVKYYTLSYRIVIYIHCTAAAVAIFFIENDEFVHRLLVQMLRLNSHFIFLFAVYRIIVIIIKIISASVKCKNKWSSDALM